MKGFQTPHYMVFCVLTGWKSNKLGSKKHAQLVVRCKMKQKDYLKLYHDASADDIQRKRDEFCAQLFGTDDNATTPAAAAYGATPAAAAYGAVYKTMYG